MLTFVRKKKSNPPMHLILGELLFKLRQLKLLEKIYRATTQKLCITEKKHM